MILEIKDGAVRLDYEPFDASLGRWILPEGRNRYKRKIETVQEEDRLWIQVASGSVTVNTSWWGEIPIFLFRSPSRCIITTAFDALFQKFNAEGVSVPPIDRIGVIESMLFDHPLRRRTLFTHVSKLMPGERITIDSKTLETTEKTTFTMPFHCGEPYEEAELADRAEEVLEELAAPLRTLTGKTLVPLSGGIDSRLLACLLKKYGVPFSSVVFGPPESAERFVATKVAKKIGVDLTYLKLEDHYYNTYGDRVTVMTGGLSSHMHCHLYSALTANGIEAETIVLGCFGGAFAGGCQPATSNEYGLSEDDALSRFITRSFQRRHLWDIIPIEAKTAVLEDLSAVMKDNLKGNLPCHFEDYFKCVERQSGLIANVYSPVDAVARTLKPYASRRFTSVFNTLPYEYRRDKSFLVSVCRRLFPEAFAVGTANQFFDPTSVFGKVESVASHALSAAAYGSHLLTKGHLAIPNPKGFERLRKILSNELRPHLESGVEKASQLLDIDLFPLLRQSAKNRLEWFSQYRMLSFGRLVEHLGEQRVTFGGQT